MILILGLTAACAVEPNTSTGTSQSTGTSNFCADGDTACQCASSPGLPPCGDQPNPPETTRQDTSDYALQQIGYYPDPAAASETAGSDSQGRVTHYIHSVFHFAGHDWTVECSYVQVSMSGNDDMNGYVRLGCTFQRHD
jgi:hypothetical protein